MKLIEYNILSNVSNACRSFNTNVKEEAQWLMASVIKMLEKHPAILLEIVKQHELEDIFISNLVDGNCSTERKSMSLEVFDSLWS